MVVFPVMSGKGGVIGRIGFRAHVTATPSQDGESPAALPLPRCNGEAPPEHQGVVSSVMSMADRKAVESANRRPRDPRAEEFARRFRDSYRILWLIAAGIVSDRTLAEDVVQEAGMIALGKLDQFREGTSFTAWKGQMVRFVALNQARKSRHRRAAELDPEAVRSAEVMETVKLTPRGDLPKDAEGFDDRVLHALQSLGETARCCLLLRTVQGLEYSEIATALGIPEGTAMSHVHRSRQALRERLAGVVPGTSRTSGSGGKA